MATSDKTTTSPTTIIIWILRILLALLFLATASAKLTGQAMMVAEFGEIGLGQWFMYLTGALELIGAVAVLVPRASVYGAALLFCIAVGAFIVQVSVLHMDWIHTVLIAVVAALVVYLQRSRVSFLR